VSRSRADRRKLDWHKAVRKQNIVRTVYRWPDGKGWYDYLHQYSKGKIHCSCPLCAAKSNPKRKRIGRGWHCPDRRRIDEMNYEKEHLYEEEL